MSRFLVDTNVISELAPGRGQANAALLAWLGSREQSLYLSVVTPLEIMTGINKLGRKSPGRRHEAMVIWAESLDVNFGERILPVTREIARVAAKVADMNASLGIDPDWPDIIIAATARHHDMTLLTRNIRHFGSAGIPIIDPFQSVPE